MKKLRAAVIGVGYLGNFHAQKYKNNSQCELIGVCDAVADQAQKIAAQLSVDSYTNPKDLIGKVDLITIAASTTYHYELASLFLNSGIAVNVEKPMTATLEQAEKLIEIQQKTKTFLTVGHIERFNPSILELKKRINQHATAYELTRLATYKTRGADVSVVYDLMIHDIDLMFWLTQSEVLNYWVNGYKLASAEADHVQAAFEMKNGRKVYISVSRVSPKMQRSIKAISSNKIIFANTGTLEIEEQTVNTAPSTPDDLVKNELIQIAKIDALQAETDHFVNCVLGSEKPIISPMDGLNSMIWAKNISAKILG